MEDCVKKYNKDNNLIKLLFEIIIDTILFLVIFMYLILINMFKKIGKFILDSVTLLSEIVLLPFIVIGYLIAIIYHYVVECVNFCKIDDIREFYKKYKKEIDKSNPDILSGEDVSRLGRFYGSPHEDGK